MWKFTAAQVFAIAPLLLGDTALSATGQDSASVGTHELSISSHDTRLSGTVVIPGESPVVAAVVFVQGAGPDLRMRFLADALARFGVAVLVYDKRGVGRSFGVREVSDHVWLISFMHYDLGFFDDQCNRVECAPNPRLQTTPKKATS